MGTKILESGRRRAVNLSVDTDLLKAAKSLDVNISRAAEAGIANAVAEEKALRWKRENRAPMDAWNDYVERAGLPLSGHRDALWRGTTSS